MAQAQLFNKGKLLPQRLRGLQGRSKVTFNVNGYETQARDFLLLVEGVRGACSEERTPVPLVNPLRNLPVTTCDRNVPVCVVHVLGTMGRLNLDHHLLIVKETIYLEAVEQVNGWHEINCAVHKILGAKAYGHNGSYARLGKDTEGYQGLKGNSIRVGFVVFLHALIRVIKGEGTLSDFANIAINLCEAVRNDEIASFIAENMYDEYNVIQMNGTMLRDLPNIHFVIKNYGNICDVARLLLAVGFFRRKLGKNMGRKLHMGK